MHGIPPDLRTYARSYDRELSSRAGRRAHAVRRSWSARNDRSTVPRAASALRHTRPDRERNRHRRPGTGALARRVAEPGAGLWDLLGGFIDEGEEPLAALRRELEEIRPWRSSRWNTLAAIRIATARTASSRSTSTGQPASPAASSRSTLRSPRLPGSHRTSCRATPSSLSGIPSRRSPIGGAGWVRRLPQIARWPMKVLGLLPIIGHRVRERRPSHRRDLAENWLESFIAEGLDELRPFFAQALRLPELPEDRD